MNPMRAAVSSYWNELTDQFGSGWNRFWYTPADPYKLGVIRIATGVVALVFQLTYSADLSRWFGPDGLLPVAKVQQLGGLNRVSWSYFNDQLCSTPGEIWFAHLVGTGVLVLFTLGLFSRVTSVLSLVVVLSYIHRAPMLTGQMEPILTMVLFYLCLGPSGACLSLDALRKRRRAGPQALAAGAEFGPTEHSVAANVSIRLMQVHLCVVYLMMGVAKIAEPGETWWQGDAVWWLAAMPESRLIDLTHLLDKQTYLVNAWSHAIVLFELALPIFVWNRLARPLLLAIALPMWIALALITGLVLFCTMMLVANLAFFSSAWLRGCCSRAAVPDPQPAP